MTTWQGSWRSPLGIGERHIPRSRDPSWSKSAFHNRFFLQVGFTNSRGCHLFCHSPQMRAGTGGFSSLDFTFIILDVSGSNNI